MDATQIALQVKRAHGRVLVALFLLTSVFAAALDVSNASFADAAPPSAAPENPTTPCTWNWNRWSAPGGFSFPYSETSFDPTSSVFSQAPSALGANGWYETSSPAKLNYLGVPEGAGPAEHTTGDKDSEWTYGVGLYVMEAGSTQRINIRDGGRQESHAFAFFNSAGEQFGRYPSMTDVAQGRHYVASQDEIGSVAGGLQRGREWTTSVDITVPADGVVFVHYLHFDERIRAEFATFPGACGPVVVDDVSTDHVPGTTAVIDVTENDSRVSPQTVSITGAGTNGLLVVPGEGTWRVGPSQGSVSFTPEPLVTASPTPIRYSARDGQGKLSRTALVTAEYIPVLAASDISRANPTGDAVTIDLTANDSGVDPSTVSIPGASLAGELVDPGRGVWTLSNNVVSFVPEPGFDGDPNSITYIVSDVVGNVLEPTTVRVSFAPLIHGDESQQNESGAIVTIDVLDNDVSSDIDPGTVSIVGADGSGRLAVEDEGIWTVDERTHEVRFIPESGFVGDPTNVSYTVADVGGDVSPPSIITLDYLPVVRDDETGGHPAGAIITIDVVLNDPSNDLDPTSVAIDHPSYDHGSRTLEVPGEGTWSVDAVTGAITVRPEDGYRGEPTPIGYVVRDDDGNVSDPAKLVIDHLPVPVGVEDESVNNRLGETVQVDVLSNDRSTLIDPLTVKIVGAEERTGKLTVRREGTWSVDEETGVVTFDPRPNFESNPTPVEYVATDVLGVSIMATPITVTYRGVIPETLAFVERTEIDRMAVLVFAGWSALLLVVLLMLARRPKPTTA